MRKTFITLSIFAALFTGQAVAGEATLNSLQANGVPMTAGQTAEMGGISCAQPVTSCSPLVASIADVVASQPSMAANIVVTAIKVNPELADHIVAAAIDAAPAQEQAIKNAVAGNNGSAMVNTGVTIPSSSTPSIGGSGGGSTSVASPN